MRGALSEPANPAMNPEEELNLRREVRATVFRLARAHHEVAPGMSLAGEFAAVQARLAALGWSTTGPLYAVVAASSGLPDLELLRRTARSRNQVRL